MESQPQNPEFRINPGNFHPWIQDKMKKMQCKLDNYTLFVLEGSFCHSRP